MWWCSYVPLSVRPAAAPYSLQPQLTDLFSVFLQDDYVRSWDENQGSNDSKFHTFFVHIMRLVKSKKVNSIDFGIFIKA